MQNDPWMKHLKEQIKWILFPKPDSCMEFRVPIYLGLQAYKDCKTSKQQELPYLSWQDLLKLLEELNLTLLGTENFHLLFLWVLVIFWNSQILFFISVTILNRYFQKHGWDWGDDLAVKVFATQARGPEFRTRPLESWSNARSGVAHLLLQTRKIETWAGWLDRLVRKLLSLTERWFQKQWWNVY